MCKHLPDNTVSLVRMINPDGYNPPVAVSPTESQDGTFTVTAQKFENGVVSCEFTLSNFASSRLQRRQAGVFALTQTASYHPLIAIGKIDSPSRFSCSSMKISTLSGVKIRSENIHRDYHSPSSCNWIDKKRSTTILKTVMMKIRVWWKHMASWWSLHG